MLAERPLFNVYAVVPPPVRPSRIGRALVSGLVFALPLDAVIALAVYELVAWLS